MDRAARHQYSIHHAALQQQPCHNQLDLPHYDVPVHDVEAFQS